MALCKGKSLLGLRIKEAGISQRKLARRLGVSDSYISKVVSNEEDFSFERAVNAADYLGCQVTDLNEWHGVAVNLSISTLVGDE